MIFTFVEEIQALWNTISPYLAGITIGGIISCLFYAFFSGSIKKFINKIQIGDMIQKTIDGTMERVKDLTISVELQPLVATELDRIKYEVSESNKELFYDVMNKMDNLINCFEKLAVYFDNSIGVPQEAKDDLHNAIDEAKQTTKSLEQETITVKPLIVDDTKKSKKQNTTNVR